LLLLGLLLVPTHYTVKGQGLILFEEGNQVGSRTGGFVDRVVVESGQVVERGQLLLELSNPEVENRLQNAGLDVAAARLRLGQLQSNPSQAGSRQLVEASRALEAAQIGLQRARDDMDALVIHSPTSGRVVGQVLQRMPGIFLPANMSFLRVVDDHKLRVVIPLTEKEVELVQVGGKVTGRWQADGRPLHTVITNLPTRRARREDYLPGMFAMHGGPAPAEVSGGFNDDPNFPLFLAEATMDRPTDLLVVEGMRVRVSIEGARTTLVHKWWREIVSFWGRKLQTFR
jgi:multidrug resistance efflux pump